MLLIGKHFVNEVLKIFEPALFSVDTKPITYMNFFCHVQVEKSVLLMRSCLWSYLKACIAQLADLRSACEKERHVPDYPFK